MLGVFKRRLKPKRATTEKESQNNRKYAHKSEAAVPVDVARIAPSQRQIHPLFEEKVQVLAYDEKTSPRKSGPTPGASLKRSPDESSSSSSSATATAKSLLSTSKKWPADSARHPAATLVHSALRKSPSSAYHPAPNICVEGGRIEFIKSPSEGSNLAGLNPPVTLPPRSSFDKRTTRSGTSSQYADVSLSRTATRAQQTQADLADFEFNEEKCDVAKEFLEARIQELQKLLESEQKNVQRERLTVTQLQRQLAKREATQRDVDKERRLRTDTESRLRETASESDRYRATLAGLQREFSKMEDTIRTMLQYKSRCELLNQEKAFLTAAYESRINQFQNTVTKLGQENESLKQQVRLLEVTGTEELPDALLDRLRCLENENAHLSQDADFQRKQYERCLDDIANQVVRALMSQKGLREEIGHLQRRIKELENQNQALANILVSKLESNESAFALPSTDGKCHEAIGGSPWYSGKDGSLPAEVKASSCTDSADARNEERKRLRRLYLSEIVDARETSINSLGPLVVVPLQRPKSLNLHLHATAKTLQSPVGNAVTNKRCQHKKNKLNSVVVSKKSTEDEGNESPESGNRDEGYSTMSSDIQGPGETSELSKRELEDLKEASDETDVMLDTNGEIASIVVVEDTSDPDMFFIPLNLSVSINPRHSYPPHKDFLPFQQAARSFSDSHLCLKLTATSPIPPPSFAPSMFFVDIIDKNRPLRRTKASSSLIVKRGDEKDLEETQSNAGSWCSGVVEGCWWDAEYVQHWLKLDDNRLKEEKREREMLQLEYDRTEIEEWSMSLSCEDLANSGSGGDLSLSRKPEASGTPGNLPSVTEGDSSKAAPEEDVREWTDYGCMNLRGETKGGHGDEANWSCEEKDGKFASWQETSPRASWSSRSSNDSGDYCRSLNENYFNDRAGGVKSKRSSSSSSSAASDGASAEGEASSAVGTDFTRDFYRLVKFESTKSLASNCSRSNGTANPTSFNPKQTEIAQEREMALQSVLSFIAEQQKYCHSREVEDGESQSVEVRRSTQTAEKPRDRTSDEENAGLSDDLEENELKNVTEHRVIDYRKESDGALLESAIDPEPEDSINTNEEIKEAIEMTNGKVATSTDNIRCQRKNDSCKGRQRTHERETSTKLPVRNLRERERNSVQNGGKSDKIPRLETLSRTLESRKTRPYSEVYNAPKKKKNHSGTKLEIGESVKSDESPRSGKDLSELLTSPANATDAILKASKTQKSRSPPSRGFSGKILPKNSKKETGIPVYSVSKKSKESAPTATRPPTQSKVPTRPKTNPGSKGTRIPVISTRKSENCLPQTKAKQSDLTPTPPQPKENAGSHVTKNRDGDTGTPRRSDPNKSFLRTTTNGSKSQSSKIVFVDDRSFHEKATTKDVIDELNRMIRKGDEVTPGNAEGELRSLDVACCCPTGWVHVERDIDFTDPKARANLLDVMLASSGSSDESHSHSNSSSSSSESGGDEPIDYTHLHRLHRFRRQRKASATREQLGALRYSLSSNRPTIIGRENFFVRYGDKEREAVACFDFLEDVSTTSISGCSSCGGSSLGSTHSSCLKSPIDQEVPLSEIDVGTPLTPTTPITPSDDSDERTGGPVSLSDSCADSYTESVESLEEQPCSSARNSPCKN